MDDPESQRVAVGVEQSENGHDRHPLAARTSSESTTQSQRTKTSKKKKENPFEVWPLVPHRCLYCWPVPSEIRAILWLNGMSSGYMKLCICGLSLMGIAYSVHFLDPVQLAKNIMLTMSDGSYLFKIWKSPPIKLYIKVYIFNITNAERFMSGEDSKLTVNEIGPYTYSEKMVNSNVSWNTNGTISYTPKRSIKFEPSMSIGDPVSDVITVANIPLLGIASMMHNSSMAMNFALSTIVSYMNAQPLLTLTVDSFLWGYDDPLVKLAARVLPSWINFERFGLLDRMMDEGKNRMTMLLNKQGDKEQFSIQNINGSPGMKQWGYDKDENRTSACNTVEGSIEGYLFPHNLQPNQSFTVYRKAFCRILPLVFKGEQVTEENYNSFLYSFPNDILDPNNPNNQCYCDQNGHCLPSGLSDLSPCYYNIPVAISLPHFLQGNKSLVDGVEGLSPDFEKHRTLIAVEPEAGVPLSVKIRLQTNLVVKHTRLIPRVRKFNDLVIPIFWMQVELLELPKSVTFLMDLLLIVGPAAQMSAIAIGAVGGLTIIFIANLRYAWRSGLFDSRRQATIISFRQKQRLHHDKVLWRSGAQYAQLALRPQTSPSRSR